MPAIRQMSFWTVFFFTRNEILFAFLLQQNVFPDRGTVYDFYFVKQASGAWNNWIERVDKSKNVIPKDAKVTVGHHNNSPLCQPDQTYSFECIINIPKALVKQTGK